MSTTPLIEPVSLARHSVASPELVINGEVTMPVITSLEQFVEWWTSDARPERGRFSYLAGVYRIDLMTEQLYSHNQIKTAIAAVLWQLTLATDQGRYFSDGADLLNPAALLATTPDGMYASFDAMRSGRVTQPPNRQQVGAIRLQGTPDMVLEVVSDSSEDDDNGQLEMRYHVAGVPEFWRVDARGELRFEILRHDPSGYVPTQRPDGWWRSEVFGRDFLMTAGVDPLDQPRYTLQHRV